MSDSTAVLLDFGGTLDADGVHWAPRFYAAYGAAGGAADYVAFERAFKATDAALVSLPGIRGLGFRALLDAQAHMLRELIADGASWQAGDVAAAFHRDALATIARNRPVVERLARRYRLGVVSNFTGNLEPCLEELGLARSFAAIVDSALVGFTKPDPRIFAHGLARLGAVPQEAWMVGDNFDADIRPAASVGMRTCWLAPPDRSGPLTPVPTARIGSFVQLESVLV